MLRTWLAEPRPGPQRRRKDARTRLAYMLRWVGRVSWSINGAAFAALFFILRWAALTDHATGLRNRRAFDNVLEDAVQRARRRRTGGIVSLVMFDLDHFKRLNDTLGHDAGDDALRAAAAAVRSVAPRPRVPRPGRAGTAARIGGEELALILPGVALPEAVALAEVARARVTAAWDRGRLTASAGVAAYPEHGLTAAQLVRAADSAMYESKRRGRDHCTPAADRAEPTSPQALR